MKLKAFDKGIFEATSYVVWDENSLESALIDSTCCVDEISDFVKENNLKLKYILITHGHFDHIYKLNEFKKTFPNAVSMINNKDLPLVENVNLQCQMAEVEAIEIPDVEKFIDENMQDLKLGDIKIKIIATPGHSQGGLCYLIDNILFSGDTLFKESIGRCDLYGGNFQEIENSIRNKLYKIPEETIVYPGHGEKTSIGYEKKFNSYFQAQ